MPYKPISGVYIIKNINNGKCYIGSSCSAIAKMFNIGKDQISKIVNNKAWQHVEG